MSNFIKLQNALADHSNRKIRNMVDRGELTELLNEFYPESLARYCSEDTEEWSKSATLRNMIQLIKLGHEHNFTCEYEGCNNLIHNMAKKNKGEFAKFCSPGCIANAKLKSKEVKDKIKKTNLEKYGHEHPLSSKEVQQTIKKSNLEKYGVECPTGLPEVQAKRVQTVKERYGAENVFQLKEVQEKSKATSMERYGVEHAQASKSIREKIKKTLKANYGSESLMGSEEIREKAKETMVERFGVDNALKHHYIKNKQRKTMKEKYGRSNPAHVKELKENSIRSTWKTTYDRRIKEQLRVSNLELLEEFKGIQVNKDLTEEGVLSLNNRIYYKMRCLECSLEFQKHLSDMPLCPVCNEHGSREEQVFRSFINNLGFTTTKWNVPSDDGFTNSYEIDIYVPELKIGFEYNGVYWHSEIFKHKEYHAMKTTKALEQGIRLYHIWSTDGLNSVQRKISRVVNKSKSINRICRDIEVEVSRDWTPNPADHHLIKQGYCFSEYLEPKEWYTDKMGKVRKSEPFEDCIRIWDSGSLRYTKK